LLFLLSLARITFDPANLGLANMTAISCPYCNVIVPAKELEDGWCENCGKKLPPFVYSRPSAGGQPCAQTKKASRIKGTAGSNAGMMVGVVLAALISSVLTMYGPLRDAPWGITGIVVFMIFLFMIGMGQAIGGFFSKG
jgi:hypothetical protein